MGDSFCYAIEKRADGKIAAVRLERMTKVRSRDFPDPRPTVECRRTEMASVVAKAKKAPFNVNVFLNTVDGGRTVATYLKDQKVFSQGDPADAVFYVQEGQVKVHVVSEQGKEAVVALHGSGDFFGEGCLTGQPLRLATVSAITDSVVMRLDKASVTRVLREEPKFSAMFMSYILAGTPASRRTW